RAEIEWGELFLEKIADGIASATDFVLFWSAAAAQSEWVRLVVQHGVHPGSSKKGHTFASVDARLYAPAALFAAVPRLLCRRLCLAGCGHLAEATARIERAATVRESPICKPARRNRWYRGGCGRSGIPFSVGFWIHWSRENIVDR